MNASRLGLLLASGLLLAWRACVKPPTSLWQDWIAVLGLYLLWRPLWPEKRGRASADAAVASFLMGVYVAGQFPQAISVFGLYP